MKRLVIILVAAILAGSTLSAQIVPGLKYKDLKDMYRARDYVKTSGDPYSTFWAGAASFVIPGLGQLICGETGRGFAIIGGDLLVGIAGGVCSNKFMDYVEKDADGNPVKNQDGDFVFTDKDKAMRWGAGILGVVLVGTIYDIWNICDAVRVAKIKNMYYNDLSGRRSMELGLYPTVDYAMTAEGAAPVAGLRLSVQF